MATKKKVQTPRALPTISMKIDEKLFARAHAYRYGPGGRISLKALVVAALDEYLKARNA
jgi:hypothetical protein